MPRQKKTVRIKQLDKPEMVETKMNCDHIIHQKLTQYPMIDEAWSTTSFNVVVGKMGQGKTSLTVSLLKNVFKKCFETIYVFMPHNSRASIENDIFGKHLPPEQLYDELTVANLTKVYEEVQEHSKEKFNSLLIIDDFQVALKDKAIISVLQKIITKQRHLRTTTFLLQQNFQALAKPLRELCSNLLLFNLGKSQLEKIFDEVVQMDRDTFEKIIDVAFQMPHDWILVNLHKSRKLYRMFDEIEILESEK